jgi:hypothetical protein
MAINVTEEGDDLTAASIDDRLQEVVDEFNALTKDDMGRKRLNDTQLPELLNASGLFTLDNGTSGSAVTGARPEESYDNTLPTGSGADTGGVHNYLELFAPSGPYGPYTRGSGNVAEEGWLIPRNSGSLGPGMSVVLNAATDLTSDNLLGIKAIAWVNLAYTLSSLTVSNDPNFTAVSYERQAAVYLGIGIKDSAGTRHVLKRTIRRTGLGRDYSSLSVSTLITPEDLTEGTLNGTVEEVFGAILSAVWLSTVDQHGSIEPKIAEFSIVVEPIRAGVLD